MSKTSLPRSLTSSTSTAADTTRRAFDLLVALLGLALVSPLFLIVAGLIKLCDPGPILYRAQRVGKDGKSFRVYKFRTMVADADRLGPGITVAGDHRITPIGRWLRRTKLDEVPQLLNVVSGEMSLVGPRPEDPRYVQHYTALQRQVLRMKPGITSPASVSYRHEEHLLQGEDWERTYLEQVLPAKLAIELEYMQRRTLWSDLTVLVRTALALCRRHSAARVHCG